MTATTPPERRRVELGARRPSPTANVIGTGVVLGGLITAFVFAIRYRLGPELHDDGAFFLRYAINMAHGHFWVWNPGHSPVWGASAPLWPLLVAGPIAAGADP
ncbi:MAG TPA: hypothetical protein VKR22_06385, partial [Acidimicrobiales bacterium]|nr:hypothetical protein [Acidimicrobiales bacterium]